MVVFLCCQQNVSGLSGELSKENIVMKPRSLFGFRLICKKFQAREKKVSSHIHIPTEFYLNDAFSALAVEETERLCAGAGVEARSPLNSPSLVQFAFSTPERIRLHGARTKYVHSQAIKGIVPRAIIERTSKAAFPMVFCTYLDHMREIFTEKIPRERSEWVTSDGMIQLYNNYHSDPLVGSPPWSLWAIYVCDKVFK